MKIAQLITRADSIGGAQIHVLDQSKSLLEIGHDVTVLVGGDGPFIDLLTKNQIRYQILPNLKRSIHPYYDGIALMEIVRALKAIQPDLLATHSSKAGLLGRFAGKIMSIPTVFTAHGWAFTDGVPPLQRRIYTLVERVTAPLAQKIITVSEYDKNIALKNKVASTDKLVTVYNGVPDSDIALMANQKTECPKIIMVARFESPKDQITLLENLAFLRQLNWTVDLIGDGPLKSKAEEVVRNLNLTDRVRFWGARHDVATILAQAQIFVLISNYEGFPLSILEAMRAGLPVIASDVGGVSESVIEGVTGYLIPRGDSVKLQQKLHKLIDSFELRNDLGSNGRERYEKYFTVPQMVDKTMQVYKTAISER
ncbi:glycosyltransferase family 4 protein [Brevibacillus brevis]|uniref:glycosyltransferase family 4 protein n=1 Tax=Brevibacillus brevis TaxID=1393 RepID=UPI0025A4E762|nr:glycosyltransferase family 4 protein [Brevibacillus brevis]WJQ81143.1 glycosyltransferase family 4 protein [Brevibacillus brevis]